MYFKVTDGKIKNSRKPIAGGFEQNGLEFECDSGRLVVVSDTELRDMTQDELDALIPIDPLPDLKAAYATARNACPATTKSALKALEDVLKEVIYRMRDEA